MINQIQKRDRKKTNTDPIVDSESNCDKYFSNIRHGGNVICEHGERASEQEKKTDDMLTHEINNSICYLLSLTNKNVKNI
ncbi:hypothetical protein DERF_010382 [Dermatophagoides farinae]|uniref:Uncharacterized protein n=1 Tax=Dermatophagoides farinae TaxID=6954 RepID=A0A922HWX2_DERFA|nr:hypothetical protein DERF_010382 [Dermatophagoides farinae]